MCELVTAIVIPVVILLFLRQLSNRWFPLVMRPLERVIQGLMRAVWTIVWKNPVKHWGALNVAFGWTLLAAAGITVGTIGRCDASIPSLAVMWLVLGATWWGLRRFQRWRLRPYRLPRRRR